MTFETALASCGRLIDRLIAWHLSLDWPFQLCLYGIYFIIISYWFLKNYSYCCDGPL